MTGRGFDKKRRSSQQPTYSSSCRIPDFLIFSSLGTCNWFFFFCTEWSIFLCRPGGRKMPIIFNYSKSLVNRILQQQLQDWNHDWFLGHLIGCSHLQRFFFFSEDVQGDPAVGLLWWRRSFRAVVSDRLAIWFTAPRRLHVPHSSPAGFWTNHTAECCGKSGSLCMCVCNFFKGRVHLNI